jgi:glyoxylase-like metal-dependent hydrolase (beta-lactamase superfamily II)
LQKRDRRQQNAGVTASARALLTAAAAVAAATLVAGQGGGLETLPVRGQVSMITNGSSNVLMQSGPQGVLLVDTLSEADGQRLLEAVRGRAAARPIRYVINTHADREFTGGNATIAAAGSQLVAGNFAGQVGQRAVDGAVPQAFVVAHENVLDRMSAPAGGRPPRRSPPGPPTRSSRTSEPCTSTAKGFSWCTSAGPRSDGDVLVFFRSSDVIAAGDIYSTSATRDRRRRAGVTSTASSRVSTG